MRTTDSAPRPGTTCRMRTRAMGGSGNPIDNSSAEQTYRAQVLYKRAGVGQWPHCGPRLFT